MGAPAAIAAALAAALAGALAAAAPAEAACPAMMAPPQFDVMPDNTQALVAYSAADRTERLVLEPSFHGTATEFGMVLPLPARPEISEADELLFAGLAEATGWRPAFTLREGTAELASARPAGVTVVDRRDVGDFEAVTLTAGSADALVGWLEGNGFAHTGADAANFEHYVGKTGYHFVAMRVNMDEASVGADGALEGRLRPVEFSFESEEPMLPFRIMASDMGEMSITLYTLGDFPYFVPGADVSHVSRVHPGSHASAVLADYGPDGRWLMRTEVEFDPRSVERDLVLSRAAGHDAALLEAAGARLPSRINHHDLPFESGVLMGSARDAVDLPPFAESMTPLAQLRAGVQPGSVECAPGMHLALRPGGGSACLYGGSVPAAELAGWEHTGRRAAELARLS